MILAIILNIMIMDSLLAFSEVPLDVDLPLKSVPGDSEKGMWSHPEPHPESRCPYPCIHEVPRIPNIFNSPATSTRYNNQVNLVCTEESYFNTITMNFNVTRDLTCNGVSTVRLGNLPNLYQYTRGLATTGQAMGLSNYTLIDQRNIGNSMVYEKAWLSSPDPCRGDILVSTQVALNDDPIYDCYYNGVTHQRWVYYTVEIRGRCCSSCYLFYGDVTLQSPIYN